MSTEAVSRVSSIEGVKWRKSSHSGDANACVEVAHITDFIGIRDSKGSGSGTLVLDAAGWRAFLTATKTR